MKNVNFKRIGYGQWYASTTHYNKVIGIHFTEAPIYDLIQSQGKGYKMAIYVLRSLIISYNKYTFN